MIVGALQSFKFYIQNSWSIGNNGALSIFLWTFEIIN